MRSLQGQGWEGESEGEGEDKWICVYHGAVALFTVIAIVNWTIAKIFSLITTKKECISDVIELRESGELWVSVNATGLACGRFKVAHNIVLLQI